MPNEQPDSKADKVSVKKPIPPGVRSIEDAPSGFPYIPDIKVRCQGQPKDAPPIYSRRRFGWDIREVSGALGDLGTLLPHIIAAVNVVGMAPAGILTSFGLFYIVSGAFYGLPMAVQPMKAASAAVIIEPMDPAAIAGAGLVIGAFFFLVGVTGLIGRIARVIPPTVAAGLQLGLGIALAALGIRMIAQELWLGIAISALMLVLLRSRRFPAALVCLFVGVAVGQITGISPPFPTLDFGIHLPTIAWPNWEQVVHGTQFAVLPQIPLTLTNAIIVAAAITHQLYPGEAHPVSERTLSVTTGLGNLIAAPFGGYLMCHGAGGIAAHHRFGARTATAPLLIGIMLVALGLFLGDSGFALLRTIPDAVLGGLLLFSGIDLALSSKLQTYKEADLFVVLLMAVIGVALNPAVAFVIGLPLAYVLQRGWLKI